MRIAFDSRPTKDSRGVGRYARCLLQALRDSDRGEIVESHAPRQCDVFHSPWIDGALLRSPIPMVVTLHDLIPLKRRGEYLRSGVRFKLRYLAVQRAVRVIVPTRAVADDAINVLEIPPERIVVIGEAAAPVLYPRPEREVSSVRARFHLPEEYLVWVGGLRSPDPRKRVAALARVERTLPLVLVGAAGRWARELPNVTLTGEVSDDELAAIYTGAHALIFPSDDEGFGLPPVEALACGTPVAACDVPAVREVLEGRVALSDVGDLAALVAAAETAQRPAPPPLSWTWADAAAATWDAYEDAYRAPARWRAARRRRSPVAEQSHKRR
ncbi:MAG TPA: glycosyltransferase family 1 protein [Solirubrobacteraceae bacterium]|nr:glycosyltransferase family 1 protein [Solirubrobacteraceae bacterium]